MPLPFKTPMTPPRPGAVLPVLVPVPASEAPSVSALERESSGNLPDDPSATLPVSNPTPYKNLRGD